MANEIKLKRGSGSNPSASDLVVGEVALRTDNGALFTKKDDGSISEIGAAAGVSDGDKGDITVSNTGTTFTIDNGVVNNAKIASDAAIDGSKIDTSSFTSNITITNSSPIISLTDSNANSDFQIKVDGGHFDIKDVTNNTGRLNIQSDGTTTISGNLNASSGLDVTGSITSTASISVPDAVSIFLGNSNDLQLKHDGTHSRIHNNTGALLLETDNSSIQLNKNTSENMLVANINGSVDLYYDNSKKLATISNGIDITGNCNLTGFLSIDDSQKIVLGDSHDLQIYHSGSHSFIDDTGTGDMYIRGDNALKIQNAAGSEQKIVANSNGSVELYFNGAEMAETTSSGFSVLGNLTITNANPKIFLTDTGDNPDYVIKNNNGVIQINDETNGATRLAINTDGHVDIDGNLDVGAGLDVTGNIVATGAIDAVGITIGGNTPSLNFNDGNDDPDFRFLVNSNSFILEDTTNSANRLVVNSDGQIGIGASPISSGALVEITKSTSDAFVNASDSTLRLLNTDTSGNTNQTSLQFTTSTTGSGADSAIVSQAEDANGNSRLEFWTDTSNGMTEKMAILSSGAVNMVGELRANGNVKITNAGPKVSLIDSGDNPDYELKNEDGEFRIRDTTNGVNRLRVTGSGTVDVAGNLDVGAGVDVTGNITATGDLTVTGGDVIIQGTEAKLHLTDTNNDDDFLVFNNNGTFKVYDATNNADRLQINSSGVVTIGGNTDFGNGIDVTGAITSTGNLTISNNAPRIDFTDGNSNPDFAIIVDGGDLNIQDTTNGENRLNINSSGVVSCNDGLAVTGNITVSGTVDGRDLATDGTKLDGIASGATNVTNNNQLTNGAGYVTTDTNNYLSGVSFDTSNGILTFSRLGLGNITVDLDGRFLTSATDNTKLPLSGGELTGDLITHVVKPDGNNTRTLGTSSARWSDVFTNDLHLSNKGGFNKVDNTWGDFTIQEGADDLFLINNRSGKMYKFMLKEVG